MTAAAQNTKKIAMSIEKKQQNPPVLQKNTEGCHQTDAYGHDRMRFIYIRSHNQHQQGD